MNGPISYVNWLASASKDLLVTHEFPLYSDAHIIGETEHGPYKLFNAVQFPNPGVVRVKIVLRWDWYLQYEWPSFAETNADQYHGGNPSEEIASLASLALGVRFRSGDATREFFPGADPKGHPISMSLRAVPTLVSTESRGWIVPNATNEPRSLDLLARLETFPSLKPETATALIRAARLYQDALWLTESEPALSWLLLVSALETGAILWRGEKEPALARFKTSKAELFDYLSQFDEGKAADRVAEEFRDSFGATKKFIDFVMRFQPGPPMQRPGWAAIDWDEGPFKAILKVVYRYRSKALHEGRPFPAPMCMPPDRVGQVLSEKPHGDVSMAGGTWKAEDVPILLNTFEYIARNVLLKWWDSAI
jgi:hypothetical protein